jgi:hypothetical protein
MQELPVNQAPVQAGRLELDEKKQRLSFERAERPGRIGLAFRRLELDCVYETLRLTGVPVSRDEVARKVEGRGSPYSHLIRGQLSAVEVIRSSTERGRTLVSADVLEVHRWACPPEGGRYRRGPARTTFPGVEPSPPRVIAERVDNLMEWLAAESVIGMHVTERAALAFTRMMEIAPFETGNFRTSHYLLSFFSLTEGLPPFCFRVTEAAELESEIERALRFDSEALVLRLTAALNRSLSYCLDVAMMQDRRDKDAGYLG